MEKTQTIHQNTHSDPLEQTLATPSLETTSTHEDEKYRLTTTIRAAEKLSPDSSEFISLQADITLQARELAARILPTEISAQLQLETKIADDLSFDHPPRPSDVIVLAQAADISKDTGVMYAFRNALISLPQEVQSIIDQAYFNSLENGDSFSNNFNPTTDEIDLIQQHEQGNTNVYIDPSLSPFNIDVPLSEQNEQLSHPVGMIGHIAVDATNTPIMPSLVLEKDKNLTYRK